MNEVYSIAFVWWTVNIDRISWWHKSFAASIQNTARKINTTDQILIAVMKTTDSTTYWPLSIHYENHRRQTNASTFSLRVVVFFVCVCIKRVNCIMKIGWTITTKRKTKNQITLINERHYCWRIYIEQRIGARCEVIVKVWLGERYLIGDSKPSILS